MPDIWFGSDWHFSHKGSLNWKRDNGSRVRPEFSTVEEMDEFMIEQHNSCVKPHDRYYNLGDVAWDAVKFDEKIAPRLNGSKRLIPGNHDDLKDVRITRHFKKVTLWRLFKEEGFLCTHLPTREDGMRHAYMNMHGHIHEKNITLPAPFTTTLDPRYLNVGVEQNCYKPLHMDQVLEYVKKAKAYCEHHGIGPAFH
jgi:calcineurin-like phosphoesterase family protein